MTELEMEILKAEFGEKLEIKDYVKKVLKSYWNYCNIYN